jgi:hypothetical protein
MKHSLFFDQVMIEIAQLDAGIITSDEELGGRRAELKFLTMR